MTGLSGTVTHARADALVRRIAGLDGDEGRREAVALGLVDGVLERDEPTLTAAFAALRDARARAVSDAELTGWLDAAIAFASWGVERAPAPVAVAPRTQAHRFLGALEGAPQVGSAELRDLLEIDETQVSRTGRRLAALGLATRRKVGRQVFWQITPRGRHALEEAPEATRSPSSEFWQAAIRRGFETASGAEPREVDPTRQRIIERTLELHERQGIQATTLEQIAHHAGVEVEAVRALFPTQDDLVRDCGEHFFETLQLPPADRAAEVFAGASSEHDRSRRLVQTFFGVYERGADALVAGRRERRHIPALEEPMEELDMTFDALVTEALRPMRPDSSSVASLRALTDVEVWRTVRDQGASPETAVERVSTAVERWLATRPRR